jgi:N-acetylglucosaminyldiphosphoundecaprenol N-acetyl-beta-D-mannosaminyltransferase
VAAVAALQAVAAVASARLNPSGRSERISILGVPLDNLDRETTRAAICRYLTDPWDGRCRQIVTLNPEYVMAARRDPVFAAAIAAADLITADGIGVLISARLLGGDGGKAVSRVTGVDLVDWLAEDSGPYEAPLFLLGGREGVAGAAMLALQERHTGARIVGSWSGGTPSPADDEASLARIQSSGAKVVAVAYGAPGQVLWIARNQQALAAAGVRVAVGIGGVLDYLAGTAPLAPTLVRRLGLEWLYRLIREPWRWRRQMVLPMFAFRVILQRLWRRGNRPAKFARQKKS